MSSDTREKILDVARRRFTEHGYEATSLREIAEDLGFTKAALYYHFQSKEQILAALLQPMDETINELLDRLTAAKDIAEWGDVLGWIVGLLHDNLEFFLLVERNRTAIEQIEATMFNAGHRQMHERVEVAVKGITDDLGQQIRMIAALGAVTAFDDWAPALLKDTEPDALAAGLRAVVADILQLKVARKRKA